MRADGNNSVITNKEEYKSKISNLLDETNTYNKVIAKRH